MLRYNPVAGDQGKWKYVKTMVKAVGKHKTEFRQALGV